MGKNIQFAIACTLAVVMIVGGILFARKKSQEGVACEHCGQVFPTGEIGTHRFSCKENDTDLRMNKPGDSAK